MQIETGPEALATRVPDGAVIAIAKAPQDPVALGRALIARGTRGLTLVTVPTGGYLADLLIGAGAVAVLESSGVSLGEHGKAPRFDAAVRAGSLQLRDATCPAIYAALQAGEKGVPFIPIRGILGADLLKVRPDWKVVQNPFAEAPDEIVLLPALRPDLALMHVGRADRFGNLWVGHRHELKTLAHAAHATLATAEEIVEESLLDDPALAPNCVRAAYVEAVAEAPRGAWPSACPKPGGGVHYPADRAALAAYARAARDEAGFAAWLAGAARPRDAAE